MTPLSKVYGDQGAWEGLSMWGDGPDYYWEVSDYGMATHVNVHSSISTKLTE